MPGDLALEKGDPWRWVVLGMFCLFSCSNAIQWITYSSIAGPARVFFNLTTNELNLLSSVYMIVFVVGAYFTCTTFERWGVRLGVLIGCGLNALGSILKVAPALMKPTYSTLIWPQALNAIAQLFVLSTPPLIAAQYFAPHQRTFATAVASTANSLGNAIALFVPPLIVKSGTKNEFMLLFCLEMGLCVLVTVGAVFFLRSPSYKAPSRALLGNLSSAPGSSRASERTVSRRPSGLGRGQREEVEAELDEPLNGLGGGGFVDDIWSRSRSSNTRSDHGAENTAATRPPTREESKTAPKNCVVSVEATPAAAARSDLRPCRNGSAAVFARPDGAAKPALGISQSVQDGVVEQSAPSNRVGPQQPQQTQEEDSLATCRIPRARRHFSRGGPQRRSSLPSPQLCISARCLQHQHGQCLDLRVGADADSGALWGVG
ncbi:hypothetical protein ABB37_08662 [Leptomonas pyrrhocoris]|uniref:Major facilitator superfamily (MFS) profile domain-containing protein n=1 Tax=Leptomonas pyrrhocoris TaxID=157538 RepID=A0A0M9FSW9_LEPPY|nr:hypothetical protein ABB37_08662 [Leptomonas pyrrhocoris]KPA75385.1 hypothetical protein ABB37_08662 [Leptomonas pyrrhocoris]|eukprot:XP_015653824.1 hypothetical protein ABB37_08662 [Leptomonas pyrrhocoris]